jgi:hypothetical protein
MPKPIIIASLGFKKPGQVKALRNLCKYLQHRDGSVRREAFLSAEQGVEHRYPDGLSDYVRPTHREVKWVDRGMGETYRQIASRAFEWQGRRTLARTWVISPDPELMKHVPEEWRFDVVCNVTERTVERWYSDNGWGQPEYSYVIHDKHIVKAERVEFGEDKLPVEVRRTSYQMVHAHVITPGTIPIDAAEDLGRVDHYVKRPHFRDLNLTAAEAFTEELSRVLGREHALEIIAERNARLERERDPGRPQRERMRQLKSFADAAQLLQAEKAARDAKKHGKKRRRTARQRQTELRMYARYVSEERSKRREADYRRLAIARRQQQEAELQLERNRTRQHIEHARSRRQRTLDVWEEELRKLETLRSYFDGIFAERERMEQEQLRDMQREIER